MKQKQFTLEKYSYRILQKQMFLDYNTHINVQINVR